MHGRLEDSRESSAQRATGERTEVQREKTSRLGRDRRRSEENTKRDGGRVREQRRCDERYDERLGRSSECRVEEEVGQTEDDRKDR